MVFAIAALPEVGAAKIEPITKGSGLLAPVLLRNPRKSPARHAGVKGLVLNIMIAACRNRS